MSKTEVMEAMHWNYYGYIALYKGMPINKSGDGKQWVLDPDGGYLFRSRGEAQDALNKYLGALLSKEPSAHG